MQISFGIVGATGRLGREIIRVALEDKALRLVGGSGRPRSPHLGEELCSGVRVSAGPQDYMETCDVLVCVATSAALEALLPLIASRKTPLVLGTTGLSEKDRSLLQEISQVAPLFYAPNFSLGMALLVSTLERWAKTAAHATIDIIEQHRAGKLDRPSGSAHEIARATGFPLWEEGTSPRDPGTLAIHSLRVGEALGEHHIQFYLGEERLELVHRVTSRRPYAEGALQALKWLVSQPPGLYSMESLLYTPLSL